MPWPRTPIAFFGEFKKRAGWALLIGAINLVGIAYGFYYYRAQFATTPWWLWVFVPDSPLAVLWAELALAAWWLQEKRGASHETWWEASLDTLAFVGNVQVGLWTVYVLSAYAGFGTFDFLHGGPVELNTVLLVGHAGMAVLGLVFVQGMRERSGRARRTMGIGLAVGAAYYLANDILDYAGQNLGFDYQHNGCGLRPYTVPCDLHGPETMLAFVTFGLTLGGLAALWALVRRAPAP